MSRFGSDITAMAQQIAEAQSQRELSPELKRMVTRLSGSTLGWGVSPVEAAVVLAGTLAAAASGMGGALDKEELAVTDISDREKLMVAVAAMRGAADVFEAIVKAGRS